MSLLAVDWANDEENIAIYDGKKFRAAIPKPKSGMVIATENIPMKYAKPLLDGGAQIFRCNTDVVARERDRQGLDKTHEADAKIIFELYTTTPEIFREFKIDPVFSRFNSLYSVFKETQHLRVATSNRLYANGDEQVQHILDGLEKQEREILKVLTTSLKEMPIYTEFLSIIKGVGPATSAGLLAYVGDPKRFPSVSHMMSYFGLDVRDGKAPRKQKGQAANWHQKGRSLLLGVIGDSFVKQRTPVYRDIYEKEKEKQLPICHELMSGKTGYKMRAEKRARRKAVKQFMKDFYKEYLRVGRGLEKGVNLQSTTRPARKPSKKRQLVAV